MLGRLKETGSRVLYRSVPLEKNIKDAGWEPWTSWDIPYSQDYYRHQGYDNPNYAKLRREGKIIPHTNWDQIRITGELKTAKFYRDFYSYGHFLYREVDWENPQATLIYDWTVDETEASTFAQEQGFDPSYYDLVQAAAAKVYNQGWDGLTFVAELHKVSRLFKNFLTKLMKYESPAALAKLWLEGRYGWRILVYDMIEIQNLLSKVKVERDRYKERVGLSEFYTDLTTEERTYGDITYTVQIDRIVECSARGSVIADIKPPKIAMNPLTTAWELITFSFVIDWIIDIGQALEALSFLALSSDYSAAGGTQLWYTKEIKILDSSSPSPGSNDVQHESFATCIHTKRNPQSVSVIPSLRVNLNALKVLDLVALFLNFLSRR